VSNTPKPPLSGGQLLVACLASLGVSRVFGVPGESYLPVLDALRDQVGQIDYVICRQEGGAAFMAEAHAKLTGEPGICFVTRGPGATNAAIGVHTAKQSSTPLLLFVGQVSQAMQGREAFQEVDYAITFADLAKWVVEVHDANRLPEIIARAWTTALSGRPGPVVVALPEDVLSAISRFAHAPLDPLPIVHPAPTAAGMQQFGTFLSLSEKPLMLVGGAGWTTAAKDALTAFAERLDIPVAVAFRCHDIFNNQHHCYVGDVGLGLPLNRRQLIDEADLIIAVGPRFGEITTQGYSAFDAPRPKKRMVHVHTSTDELGKVYQADLPLQASAEAFCSALHAIGHTTFATDWRGENRAAWLASQSIPSQPGSLDMGVIIQWLDEHLTDDAIVTHGAGNFTLWPDRYLCFGHHRRLLAPQSGAMGYGLPAAIAAKIRYPQREVVCFAGDGDFQMNCQELGSALQRRCAPITLLLNNGSYGTIRMHQERHFPNRVFGTDIVNPDFLKLAQAYGLVAERIERTEQFADAFERARAADSGALLELVLPLEALTPTQRLSQIRAVADLTGSN